MRSKEIKKRKRRNRENSDDEQRRLNYNEYTRDYKWARRQERIKRWNLHKETSKDKTFFKNEINRSWKYKEKKRDAELKNSQEDIIKVMKSQSDIAKERYNTQIKQHEDAMKNEIYQSVDFNTPCFDIYGCVTLGLKTLILYFDNVYL